MKAEIVSIGTELLLGEITDTNATHIATELRNLGIDLHFRTTVGDNLDRIAYVLDLALDRADLIITSGGLGPTVDDVTREAIAKATDRALEFKQELYDQIVERFRRFGAVPTENNKRQAYVPQGALPIENPVGTAPIFVLETERGTVMVLPGVPREMKYLLEHALIPWLKANKDVSSVIVSHVLRTAGIGESTIDSVITDLMEGHNPTVGLSAHTGQTDIRITAKATTHEAAEALIAPIELELRKRLGDHIYATGKTPIEDAVVAMLSDREQTVACLEVMTESETYHRLRTACLREGISSPDYVSLSSVDELIELGIPRLHPLSDMANSAAIYCMERHAADFGLAVIVEQEADGAHVAGIAVVDSEHSITHQTSWANERSDYPTWLSTYALAMLLRLIRQHSGHS